MGVSTPFWWVTIWLGWPGSRGRHESIFTSPSNLWPHSPPSSSVAAEVCSIADAASIDWWWWRSFVARLCLLFVCEVCM
uniref:Putative secreted protein n=1 Tax=Anopheles triannulatus TaxID=58253 RepID=A0A2M4B717_9DIPT